LHTYVKFSNNLYFFLNIFHRVGAKQTEQTLRFKTHSAGTAPASD